MASTIPVDAKSTFYYALGALTPSVEVEVSPVDEIIYRLIPAQTISVTDPRGLPSDQMKNLKGTILMYKIQEGQRDVPPTQMGEIFDASQGVELVWNPQLVNMLFQTWYSNSVGTHQDAQAIDVSRRQLIKWVDIMRNQIQLNPYLYLQLQQNETLINPEASFTEIEENPSIFDLAKYQDILQNINPQVLSKYGVPADWSITEFILYTSPSRPDFTRDRLFVRLTNTLPPQTPQLPAGSGAPLDVGTFGNLATTTLTQPIITGTGGALQHGIDLDNYQFPDLPDQTFSGSSFFWGYNIMWGPNLDMNRFIELTKQSFKYPVVTKEFEGSSYPMVEAPSYYTGNEVFYARGRPVTLDYSQVDNLRPATLSATSKIF